MDTTNADKYTYEVRWSENDQEFIATILEFPSLSWLAEDKQDAISGAQSLVEEVVRDMIANNEKVPSPLGQREFSGRFNVRLPKSLHRDLAISAEREGVSLNTFVTQKLAQGLN
ncbi:type II toxin-antitoxin system HicB family antitoxin [Corynebacterium lubricantis]|uniref:type II toxin-antitoxin system HicB family antitoxin n=1 Tax=Corynebacterium lubricantis TaxID=541095 RepID=UPI00036EA960|nr:type II toxin-antitoxin system HicB family antitoxin [Corynebacterium lubricantis]